MGSKQQVIAGPKETRALIWHGRFEISKEAGKRNLSPLVRCLLAFPPQGFQQMTRQQAMPILFFSNAVSGGGQRETHTPRTRGTLCARLAKIEAQALGERLKIRIRGAVSKLPRITAIQDTEKSVCFFMLKELFAEPAQ
jgi:hypothetical protein